MSHLVTIQAQFKSRAAIASACSILGLPAPVDGTHDVYSKKIQGTAVRLPDWCFPVVLDTNTGQAHFDDYNGQWGARKHLDRFTQRYTVEAAKIEARRAGHRATETTLPDGSIRLHLTAKA